MICNNLDMSLEGHCIETEVKNEFRRLMDSFFTGDDSPEIQGKIEFLRDFIEVADFPMLRASDPRMNGDPPSIVSLSRSGGDFSVAVRDK